MEIYIVCLVLYMMFGVGVIKLGSCDDVEAPSILSLLFGAVFGGIFIVVLLLTSSLVSVQTLQKFFVWMEKE